MEGIRALGERQGAPARTSLRTIDPTSEEGRAVIAQLEQELAAKDSREGGDSKPKRRRMPKLPPPPKGASSGWGYTGTCRPSPPVEPALEPEPVQVPEGAPTRPDTAVQYRKGGLTQAQRLRAVLRDSPSTFAELRDRAGLTPQQVRSAMYSMAERDPPWVRSIGEPRNRVWHLVGDDARPLLMPERVARELRKRHSTIPELERALGQEEWGIAVRNAISRMRNRKEIVFTGVLREAHKVWRLEVGTAADREIGESCSVRWKQGVVTLTVKGSEVELDKGELRAMIEALIDAEGS